MLEELRNKVYKANISLPEYKLITFTWGNVSGIDRDSNLVVIKPSGVAYKDLTPETLVVVNLKGEIIEGDFKPSSDTATHIELYKNFKDIGGIVHTHSPWAVSFAQAGKSIPAAGTTQADYFYGAIPVTRAMNKDEIEIDYELKTGSVIIETFDKNKIDPNRIPGVLVNDHGPFTWGKNPEEAVHNSVVLEEVAEMTYHSLQLSSDNIEMSQELLDKHYLRKHGDNAYYGQN